MSTPTAEDHREATHQSRAEEAFAGSAQQLANFIASAGRWPRPDPEDEAESVLARFLDQQRAAYKGNHQTRAKTSPVRRAILDTHVPGWNDPGAPGRGHSTSADQADRGYEKFAAKVMQIAGFVYTYDRWPRRKVHGETQMAKFLAVQRSVFLGIGTGDALPTERRRQLLDQAIPGWDNYKGEFFTDLDPTYLAQLSAKLRDFSRAHGRNPKADADDSSERELALFAKRLSSTKSAKPEAHPLSPEEFASTRVAMGFTHVQFADWLEIGLQTVHRWEAGEHHVSAEAAVAIRRLRVQVRRLVEQLVASRAETINTAGVLLSGVPQPTRRVVAARAAEQLPNVLITTT